jgi:hypothetical protein
VGAAGMTEWVRLDKLPVCDLAHLISAYRNLK